MTSFTTTLPLWLAALSQLQKRQMPKGKQLPCQFWATVGNRRKNPARRRAGRYCGATIGAEMNKISAKKIFA
ncbi:MAG: hypothetical protein OXH59_10480 [Rhodospirillaceae bacterium]|nr:hypothetical protein [Rhodospirillaceae bacterium]